MDTSAIERVALMSIKPQFALAILDGTKNIEFRKRRLAPDISTVIIYATLPIGSVIGTFTVAAYDEDRPTPLWERHRQHAGISRQAYRDYYKNSQRAVGIMVDKPFTLPEPIPLLELSDGVRPPQSFSYLDWSDLCAELRRDIALFSHARETKIQIDTPRLIGAGS